MTDEVIHPEYLPFSSKELSEHFLLPEGTSPEAYTDYYIKSADRYKKFDSNQGGLSLSDRKLPCQIEKDERFWVATCLMKYFHSPDPGKSWAALLSRAFKNFPPIQGMTSWESCLRGKLHLFFEAKLPAPRGYKNWLKNHLRERNLIPYVLDAAYKSGEIIRDDLEGPTHVDALLINEDNGFAVLFEAKVLSDISCQVSFDISRNQIARNIDVMLEDNSEQRHPLNKRNPNYTLFVLLTPDFFRENCQNRLYGWLMNEYRKNPSALARDIPHRQNMDWSAVSKRLGWLTWEDSDDLLPGTCRWLKK